MATPGTVPGATARPIVDRPAVPASLVVATLGALGFAAVSVVSLLHVVLEFPLNFVSIRAILGAVLPKPRLAWK